MVQEAYETAPAICEACERCITGHAATLEADIDAAMRARKLAPDWTAISLALHTQAVIQGAFILAKATGGAEVAADSIDHLRRYIENVSPEDEKETPDDRTHYLCVVRPRRSQQGSGILRGNLSR